MKKETRFVGYHFHLLFYLFWLLLTEQSNYRYNRDKTRTYLSKYKIVRIKNKKCTKQHITKLQEITDHITHNAVYYHGDIAICYAPPLDRDESKYTASPRLITHETRYIRVVFQARCPEMMLPTSSLGWEYMTYFRCAIFVVTGANLHVGQQKCSVTDRCVKFLRSGVSGVLIQLTVDMNGVLYYSYAIQKGTLTYRNFALH